MAYYIDCFRSYEIRNMMDYSGDYELKLIDECDGKYIYPSILSKINDYLEKYKLQILYTLIPLFMSNDYFESITQEKAKNIAKRFVKPSNCISYIKENKILEKIMKDKPNDYKEMIFVLENLLNKWKDGYYVYEWY